MRRRALALMVVGALGLASCRPPIAEAPGASGGTGPDASGLDAATDTPPPAAALKPDHSIQVELHLFRGLGTADSAFQYAQALDSYREVNLAADLVPPIPGYDPFAVTPVQDQIDLWIGTASDVAPSAAAGLKLVAVGEVSGHDPTVLVTPKRGGVAGISKLRGKRVVAETAAAAASLRAALTAAGVDAASVAIQVPDDPTAPFDPTPLLDGTADAAAVSLFEGWARTEEALVAAGEPLTSFVEKPLAARAEDILGELVWAKQSDLDSPVGRSATTALLGVLAQSQIACANAIEDCAGAVAAQSDRTPEGIAWSIDQLDRTIFPAPDGIVHIDPPAWTRTISAMTAAGIPGVAGLTFTDDLVDAVTKALGANLDLKGATWSPRTDLTLAP